MIAIQINYFHKQLNLFYSWIGEVQRSTEDTIWAEGYFSCDMNHMEERVMSFSIFKLYPQQFILLEDIDDYEWL